MPINIFFLFITWMTNNSIFGPINLKVRSISWKLTHIPLKKKMIFLEIALVPNMWTALTPFLCSKFLPFSLRQFTHIFLLGISQNLYFLVLCKGYGWSLRLGQYRWKDLIDVANNFLHDRFNRIITFILKKYPSFFRLLSLKATEFP